MPDATDADLIRSDGMNGGSRSPEPDLAEALRRLPMAQPLPGGWARLQHSLRAEAPVRRRAPHPAWWALAASLLLATALPSLLRPPVAPALTDAAPPNLPSVDPGNPRLALLQRESALLDQLVAQQLDASAQQADWAALSLQVVERVQWIDSVLSQPGHSEAAQFALWSERVLLLRQLANPQPAPGWRSAEAGADHTERSFAL